MQYTLMGYIMTLVKRKDKRREANGTYDASILIDRSGEVIGIQKMVHVAQVEQFYEQDYYTPSDDGFHVFDTEFGKIGICGMF